MMPGARTAAWAKSGGGVPTARDYVQNGLIAMWDGIENAGWGVHNPNAMVRKDLVGNCDCEVYTGNPSWDEKCFIGDRSTFFAGKSQLIGNAIVSNSFTLEMFIDYRKVPVSIDSKMQQGQFGVFNSLSNSNTNRIFNPMWNWVNSFYTTYRGAETDHGSFSQKSRQCYFKGDGSCRILGVDKSMNRSNSIGDDYFVTLGAFGIPLGIKYSTYSKIYAIRLYNKIITDKDLSDNYAVDKARFNLP